MEAVGKESEKELLTFKKSGRNRAVARRKRQHPSSSEGEKFA